MLNVELTVKQLADDSWEMFFHVEGDGKRWCDKMHIHISPDLPTLQCIVGAWDALKLYLRLAYGQHAKLVTAQFIKKDGTIYHPPHRILLKNFE